jgi:hypothetical protein
MENKQIPYAQIPLPVLACKSITPILLRVYAALEFLNFQGEAVNSNYIAELLNISRDSVRRYLNKLKRIFETGDGIPENFISFHVVKKPALNLPDNIIIHFNYRNKPLNIEDQKTIPRGYYDRKILNTFISGTNYFKDADPNHIMRSLPAVPVMEIIKGILYVESRRNISKPLAYLVSCFDKKAKCKYDVPLRKATKKPKPNSTNKEPYVYGVSIAYAAHFKAMKEDNIHVEFYENKGELIIFSVTEKLRLRNIKSFLENNHIEYEVYERSYHDMLITLNTFIKNTTSNEVIKKAV